MTTMLLVAGTEASVWVEVSGRPSQDWAPEDLAVDLQNDLAVDLHTDLAVAPPETWTGVSAALALAVPGAI